MPGWADIGGLAGLPAQNELSYEKGLSLGANTQNAMQMARERVRQNQSMEQLTGLADELGIPQAMVTALQAGINPTQITGAAKDIQESGFRNHVVDPTTGANQTQRYLAALAPGSFAQPIDKVGGGSVSKLNPEAGVIPLPAGAHESGGGVSSQIQLLTALGLIDENGQITDPKLAMANLREMNHFGDAGGVPIVTNTNPYGAPSAAPAVPGDLGAELAPPMQAPAPAAGPAPVVPASTKPPVAPPAASQVVPTSQAASNVAAIEQAKILGKGAGEAAVGAPGDLAEIDKLEKTIDNFTGMKGFDSVYGHIQGRGPVALASGLLSQDTADAQAALKNIDAQTFGIAIDNMRGMGSLSNAEGSRVTDAFTVLSNPTISPQMARQAAQIVKEGFALARTRIQKKQLLPVQGGPGSTAPAAGGVAPYTDAAKEARYQAWKAAQGQ